jgi:hypothetical protein
MDDRRGSITVSALVGTGAATLGLALFGLAGIGTDLRAADAAREAAPPAPVVTQDLSETLREERSSPKWDGRSPLPTPTPSASPTPSPQPQKEL